MAESLIYKNKDFTVLKSNQNSSILAGSFFPSSIPDFDDSGERIQKCVHESHVFYQTTFARTEDQTTLNAVFFTFDENLVRTNVTEQSFEIFTDAPIDMLEALFFTQDSFWVLNKINKSPLYGCKDGVRLDMSIYRSYSLFLYPNNTFTNSVIFSKRVGDFFCYTTYYIVKRDLTLEQMDIEESKIIPVYNSKCVVAISEESPWILTDGINNFNLSIPGSDLAAKLKLLEDKVYGVFMFEVSAERIALLVFSSCYFAGHTFVDFNITDNKCSTTFLRTCISNIRAFAINQPIFTSDVDLCNEGAYIWSGRTIIGMVNCGMSDSGREGTFLQQYVWQNKENVLFHGVLEGKSVVYAQDECYVIRTGDKSYIKVDTSTNTTTCYTNHVKMTNLECTHNRYNRSFVHNVYPQLRTNQLLSVDDDDCEDKYAFGVGIKWATNDLGDFARLGESNKIVLFSQDGSVSKLFKIRFYDVLEIVLHENCVFFTSVFSDHAGCIFFDRDNGYEQVSEVYFRNSHLNPFNMTIAEDNFGRLEMKELAPNVQLADVLPRLIKKKRFLAWVSPTAFLGYDEEDDNELIYHDLDSGSTKRLFPDYVHGWSSIIVPAVNTIVHYCINPATLEMKRTSLVFGCEETAETETISLMDVMTNSTIEVVDVIKNSKDSLFFIE
ncbi:hypothetical protein PCE1_001049 [Barthelona sp. PCE]